MYQKMKIINLFSLFNVADDGNSYEYRKRYVIVDVVDDSDENGDDDNNNIIVIRNAFTFMLYILYEN